MTEFIWEVLTDHVFIDKIAKFFTPSRLLSFFHPSYWIFLFSHAKLDERFLVRKESTHDVHFLSHLNPNVRRRSWCFDDDG